MKPTERQWLLKWQPWILWDKRSEIYVWSYNDRPFIRKFLEKRSYPVVRVEDGFLRSVKLGAEHFEPISMVFDRSGGLYFDATRPNDLENLIQSFDRDKNQLLIARAKSGIERLLETRLSKYNTSNDYNAAELYGPKHRKRVLVVGQVEGDMSMKLGMERQMTNNELVWYAARENPDAEIIYKPHPEVLRGIRKDPPQSDPAEVRRVARVLTEDVTLADAFETIDHVYTMTSLSGFEALLRGIKVTCLGMPFYAGYGLTDDRQACGRRTARPTVEEIFAAAYILYPRYFDPILKEPISFEQALDLLAFMRDRLMENREKQEPEVAPLAALG
ncbi:capsular polysaccharide biosynthesis protein [uncultured Roseibium sp.]|uniref:capsular polysaccharide export protein, LipB/KpsS family n=1 Tax=uncultured Roseibium sp. TaxID=1936171 RepID=UPI002617693F|nr:capsular polysaccharide biosynthesis protein [uncultured Roseibium sp.]